MSYLKKKKSTVPFLFEYSRISIRLIKTVIFSTPGHNPWVGHERIDLKYEA